MLPKTESRKKIGESTNSLKLLNDIEAISKALYLEEKSVKSLSSTANTRSKSAGKAPLLDAKGKLKDSTEDPIIKNKKSIWNWKLLKAFSSIKNRRFSCCFSLEVHSIEGLPQTFNDVSLLVHWKRRDGSLETRPTKVLDGTVKFEEILTHTCSVYGSRNGPHHSAKYEAKHFLLYASVFGKPELDLGKHWVDLTRLLPLTLEELGDEKSTGKWTTSFKLSGKAKGATMNVSFGYTLIGDNTIPNGNNRSVPEVVNVKWNDLGMIKPITKFGTMQQIESIPGKVNQLSHSSTHSMEDIKDLHKVLPTSRSELASSVQMLCKKFDGENFDSSIDHKPELDPVAEHHLEPIKPQSFPMSVSGRENVDNEYEDNEFSVIEQGIELSSEEHNEEKLDSSIDHKPELDLAAEHHLEPIKLHSFPMSVSGRENVDNECEDNEFSIIEQGIELPSEEHTKSLEYTVETTFPTLKSSEVEVEVDTSATAFKKGELSQDGNHVSDINKIVGSYCSSKDDDIYSKESLMKDLESALSSVSNLVLEAADSPEWPESHMEINSDHKVIGMGRSHSLDDVTASVATEFLDMLGIEHSPFGLSFESEPESPRERLLRQLEKDALAGGRSLFDFGIAKEDQTEFVYGAPSVYESGNFSEDFEPPSAVQAAEGEPWMSTQDIKSKMKAMMLEDLETEALMREWGLSEKAFQSSPTESSSVVGSPCDLPLEEPFQLPPLGEGMGPYLQTKNGGFLRSMSPSLFSNAKGGRSLIMQVSSPIVVPADIGSSVMEILQRLASVGIEKLSMQMNKLIPLEDITGKTMQQVAWESATTLEGLESQHILQHDTEAQQDFSDVQKTMSGRSSGYKSSKLSSNSTGNEICSEYVSLEDLAPLAMDKIEALSMEGLRIQSGMSDEDAPSNISAGSIGEISALQGKGFHMTASLGLEGTGGLPLLDIKDSCEEVDGLMGLSLTLDEWMRLDSGEIYDEDQISEHTSKILTAHHATSLDLIHGWSKGERRHRNGSGRKYGLLGNNFTAALIVQLHDPLRNYELVGAPMLSLIQVERVFVPPKPKIYCMVPELRNNSEEYDESESTGKEAKETKEEKAAEEEGIPHFRITEVHVAGLKTEPEKKKLWGTKTQQQSGSRWLLANGMGKNNNHPFMKSKTFSKSSAPLTTKVQPSDTLWSISSCSHGTGDKWKELAAANAHIRNPNIIFTNETTRLQ